MRIEDCNTKEKFVAFLEGQLEQDISKDLFRQIIQKTLSFGISDTVLAKEFKVSVETIGRRLSGETAPHPVGRPSIVRHLITMLQPQYA
jgi:hypothetical protein